MRARRLLFPCASAVFLIAVSFAAFVFWASQPSTVELPWMRWAFLASAALLLLKWRPALGVVVIDERGVLVRTLRMLTKSTDWQSDEKACKPRKQTSIQGSLHGRK